MHAGLSSAQLTSKLAIPRGKKRGWLSLTRRSCGADGPSAPLELSSIRPSRGEGIAGCQHPPLWSLQQLGRAAYGGSFIKER